MFVAKGAVKELCRVRKGENGMRGGRGFGVRLEGGLGREGKGGK